MLEERCLQNEKRKALVEATAQILGEYGVHAGSDIEKMEKEEVADVYESLSTGIMEKYGLDWDALDALVDEVLDMYAGS